MFLVEIRVTSLRDGETVDVEVIIDKLLNGEWKIKDVFEGVYGKTAPSRKLLLVEGERLRVEMKSNVEIVWDKEQNAAVSRVVTRKETAASEEE